MDLKVATMQKQSKGTKGGEDLEAQMATVREFMDVFYDKTLFQNEQELGSELKASQIRALFAFRDEHAVYTIGELRKNARVKRSTITSMVDRLEQDGLAGRVRDDGDRRVVKVQLTEKGKKIRKEFYQKRRKEMMEVFLKLKREERLTLLNHLRGAYSILKKI